MSLRLRLLVAGICGLIALCLVVLLLIPGPPPPISSLEKAKLTLTQARNVGAPKYAEELYRSTERLIREGWMEMAKENGHLSPFRNYKVADSLLCLAIQTATQAAQEAKKRVFHLDSIAQNGRADLENELSLWREALNSSLVMFKASSYLSSADLSVKMSELLIDRGQYMEAFQSLADGRKSLSRLSDMLAEYTNDETKKMAVWRRWVQETLAQSRKTGTYAVIVDKVAHKAYLVRAGNLVYVYDCELGYNSSHNKLFAGDGATPEGKYEITKVKSKGSKYYKALLLNYPNPADKKRFEENKRKGIISSHARIGGLIEIHGDGGKNKDWTEGCVALTNDEMDDIMRYVTLGTQVTIVRRSDQWP